MGGRPHHAHGDALLSGTYLNELLLRLLARDDPHAHLFDSYGAVVRVLASEHGEALEPVPRSFELLLLREIGLLPALDAQTLTGSGLAPEARYALVAEGGLRAAAPGEQASLSGARWLHLHDALQASASLPNCCAPARRWPANSNRNCAPCCNTIAAARCCARASS